MSGKVSLHRATTMGRNPPSYILSSRVARPAASSPSVAAKGSRASGAVPIWKTFSCLGLENLEERAVFP